MVKSYTKFELEAVFGIVSSASGVAHIPAGRGPGKAVVGAGEAVQIWDLKTSELLDRFVDPQLNVKVQVVQLAYDAQSELIAAGYSDGSVRIWDIRSASIIVVFNGHKSFISALKFSADGTMLFSASADTTIIAWDLINEQGLYRLKGHKGVITGLVLHPEKAVLVSTSKDGIIKLWDLETQFATETHVAHKGECWGLTFIDNNRLATVSNGTELKIWQLDFENEEGHQISSLGEIERHTKHRAVSLIWDAKTTTLLCASGDSVQTWKKRTAEELKKAMRRRQKRAAKKPQLEDEEADLKLSMKDEYVSASLIRTKSKVSSICLGANNQLVANLGSNSVECWTYAANEEPERTFVVDRAGHRTDVRDAAVSSDGLMIATGSNGSIKVYNQKSRAVLRTLVDTNYILALRFLPGDGLLVAGTKEGSIDIYDIAKSTLVSSIPDAHVGAVWSLDLSSDGRQLVSGGADKSVKFWALTVIEEEIVGHPELPKLPKMTLKNTHKLEFNDDVLAVKLSPDMRFVAASLLDSTVKVYYRDTLKFYLNLYGHQLPVLSIDISHDSKLIVTSSADKNVKIWGLDFGDCHKSIFAHEDSVLRVVFEPGTHNFLSASKDGLVKYWDGVKFAQIQRLDGHHSEVWALAIASDGAFAVSASHDKTVRIWEMTDEPLFIEEERENEMEHQYEENLIESLERDDNDMAATHENEDEDGENDQGIGGSVSKHSVESLKAGERLFETLDICTTDLEEHPSPRHVILAALNISAERYLMDVLAKIKTPIVEDALLTFPLDRIVKLLKFVVIWLEKKWNIQLVCRVLFFSLRTFHRQLVANKMLQSEFEDIRDKLRAQLFELSDAIGFNLAQMTWIQSMWDESHIKDFPGFEDTKGEGRKRVYKSVDV